MFEKLLYARRLRASAIAIVALGVAACDRTEPKRPPPPPVARTTTDSTATVEVSGDVTTADTSATGDDQVWITDANALALLGVMNTRQIAVADVQLEGWHSDTVRAFAASVARDHAGLQHSVDSVVTRIHLAPVMSALGQRIDTVFRVHVDSLRGYGGPGLERAFAHQLGATEDAMAAYADQLTGAATAPEVRALMQTAATRARAESGRAHSLEAGLLIADSLKKAAAADSVARVEARRERRLHKTP